MLYRSTLGLFKESAEEGKKLMKGCQASYMEPPESPREEGTEQWLQVVFFLFSFSLGFFFFLLQPGHLYPSAHPPSCSADAVSSIISPQ